jgi:3-hydroxy acid dehydrogenase / malonic semialdehyde reductase
MSGFTAGETVMITGASAGIGEATARKFAQAGARLILLARRLDRIEALAKELGNAEAHALDVSDSAAAEALLAKLPTPDVLVNNAGLSRGLEPWDQTTLDDFEEMMDTNVKGLYYVTRKVLGGMRQRNTGHVVNVGSVAGFLSYRGGSGYCATKAAVHALSQCLRADVEETNIRVSEIAPGMVKTEFSLVRFHGDEEKAEAVYKGLENLTAEDMAEAIFFCVNAPKRMNVDLMVIFPQQQHMGPAVYNRR